MREYLNRIVINYNNCYTNTFISKSKSSPKYFTIGAVEQNFTNFIL